MTVYRCNVCGTTANGRAADLYEQGWRCHYIRRSKRIVKLIGCPQHANNVVLEAVR